MLLKEVKKDIYYIGVNDRRTPLFENMLPLPHGISYNSYLIKGEKNTLMDCVDVNYASNFVKKLQIALAGEKLDYLVINHMEPDHGGSIAIIRQYFPEVTLVGNKKTFDMLEGYFGINDNLLLVKEGDELDLGNHKLHFYMTPMVHWPEVMVTYESSEKILFSADAFGTFGTLDGGVLDTELNLEKYENEMRRYYACIVGKYGKPVQTAMKKICDLEINTICSLHGPIWTEHIDFCCGKYDKWSKYEAEEKGVVIAYGSMYGNTEEMAEEIAGSLSRNGVKNIVIHDVSKTDSSYILADIFRYNGLIIGSPTYCNELYPGIKSLLDKIQTRGITNKVFSYFGNYTWADASAKNFKGFVESMKWEAVGEPFIEKMALKDDKLEMAHELGRIVAEKVL